MSYKEFFFSGIDDKFSKIYPDGSHRVVLEKAIRKAFSFKDKMIAIDFYNGFWVSKDDGESWLQEGYFSNDVARCNFYTIGDSLILTPRTNFSQIYTMDVNSWQSRELKNDGLEGRYILYLAEFNGKVYASTYSGVFEKNIDDFFENK